MSDESLPLKGQVYRHFKGPLYRIIAVAKDVDDLELKVVYRDLDHPDQILVERLENFSGYTEINDQSFKQFEGPIRIASSKGFGGLGPK